MDASNTKTVTTEDLISKVGSCGPFQILLVAFVTYVELCWSAFAGGITLFLIAEPRWKCSTNSTICNITGTVGPGELNYNYRCAIPRQEWTFESEYTSLVTQFDLVCDKSTYGTNIITISSLGGAVGALLVGIISDRIGRRSAIFLSGLIVNIILLYLRFSQNYWMAAIPMFFLGAGHFGALFAGLVYSIEFVGIKQRPLVGNAYWAIYGLGFMVFAGIGYLAPEWKTFVLILALCGLPGLVLCWLAPESLRWLIAEGKEEQAHKTLKIIAKINRKDIANDIALPKYTKTESKSSHDIRMLFRSGYAKYTLVIWFAVFADTLIYHGVYLIAPSIGGNVYLNWFLSGLAEVFSSIIGSLVHSRFQRKKATALGQVFAGLSAFVGAMLVLYDDGTKGFLAGKILMTLVLPKFFIAIALNGLNLIVAELYPTVIRNTAQGACSCWGSLSVAASAYVVYMIRIHTLLPFSIMSASTLVAGVLVLAVLKETSKQAMIEIFPEDEKNDESEMTKLINK